MITRDCLRGSYSDGEALAIYHEMRRQGDFAAVCRILLSLPTESYSPALLSVRRRILHSPQKSIS